MIDYLEHISKFCYFKYFVISSFFDNVVISDCWEAVNFLLVGISVKIDQTHSISVGCLSKSSNSNVKSSNA